MTRRRLDLHGVITGNPENGLRSRTFRENEAHGMGKRGKNQARESAM